MAFKYEKKFLHIDGVNLKKLADKIGTPFYCYSKKALVDNFNKFKKAFPKADICYAVKANANLHILKTLAGAGAGADVVSGGELFLALKAGIPGDKIVYSGVGKTPKDIALAIQNNIKQINVESEDELNAVNQTAIRLMSRANIALRVNPDVKAGTHKKITTGTKENKFGIYWDKAFELYKKAANMSGVRVRGIAIHIGSQILSLDPFEKAFVKLAKMIDRLEAADINIQNIDVGGGLGVVYKYKVDKPVRADDFAKLVNKYFKRFKKNIILEPGRKIVANAGVLVSSVLYNKRGEDKDFLIIDAGMNDFARPALYDAWHEILPVRDWNRPIKNVDVVGPICESSDTFAKNRPLPALEPGELVALMGTGAYGMSMASTYNIRPMLPEILAEGGNHKLIRRRQTLEEIIEDQIDV